ncbi:uncharacterized protein AMSG_08599 [Thecamonas trahens ATCC 50062]|uniref:Uncharacterized protein n=1 Tax=Thecamonas trahens ATCC 50062 TaxID=461836 RepID=A0A0L0DMS8_THETB|nr:hypothetical protein AMSG_08599 [Thecamonas trahens ATCC 50062]KNC52718.1 hypothetical protein AMSG_08599 [Thecamonas trahens ATCC 50062]|eukprot:XP_013755034.1 hypothetical protein AMSG_08599 [Thecamonas trahens ATCC 50062]
MSARSTSRTAGEFEADCVSSILAVSNGGVSLNDRMAHVSATGYEYQAACAGLQLVQAAVADPSPQAAAITIEGREDVVLHVEGKLPALTQVKHYVSEKSKSVGLSRTSDFFIELGKFLQSIPLKRETVDWIFWFTGSFNSSVPEDSVALLTKPIGARSDDDEKAVRTLLCNALDSHSGDRSAVKAAIESCHVRVSAVVAGEYTDVLEAIDDLMMTFVPSVAGALNAGAATKDVAKLTRTCAIFATMSLLDHMRKGVASSCGKQDVRDAVKTRTTDLGDLSRIVESVVKMVAGGAVTLSDAEQNRRAELDAFWRKYQPARYLAYRKSRASLDAHLGNDPSQYYPFSLAIYNAYSTALGDAFRVMSKIEDKLVEELKVELAQAEVNLSKATTEDAEAEVARLKGEVARLKGEVAAAELEACNKEVIPQS